MHTSWVELSGRLLMKFRHEEQTWYRLSFCKLTWQWEFPTFRMKMIHKWQIVEFPSYYVGLLKGSSTVVIHDILGVYLGRSPSHGWTPFPRSQKLSLRPSPESRGSSTPLVRAPEFNFFPSICWVCNKQSQNNLAETPRKLLFFVGASFQTQVNFKSK